MIKKGTDKNDIEIRVKEILSDKLAIPIKEIKPTSLLSDELGLDSFGMVEIGFAIEEAFHIKIMKNASNIPRIITLKDLVKFIESKINSSVGK